MPKYLVQTIQTFRMDYVIEAKEESDALDELVCRNMYNTFEEVSQKNLEEIIVDSREITDEEYIQFFNKQNPDLADWDDEIKSKWIHKIEYDDWEFS